MRDASFFTQPVRDWQRRYEALRASFVDQLPATVVADRFGYSTGYVHLLRHLFKHGKINLADPPSEEEEAEVEGDETPVEGAEAEATE